MDTSWRLTSNLATFDLDNVFALVHRGMIKSLLQSWWKCKSNLQTGLFAFLKINYLRQFLWRSLTVKCGHIIFPHFAFCFSLKRVAVGQQLWGSEALACKCCCPPPPPPPQKNEEKLSNVPESKVKYQILILDGQKTKWKKQKQTDIGNTIPILHCSKIIIEIMMMGMMILWKILYLL